MNPGYVVIDGTYIRFYTSTPFTSLEGVEQDPSEVIFGYKINDEEPVQITYGSVTPEGEIKRIGPGNYYIDLDTTDKPGIWTYTWVGIGQVQTRSENQLVVKPAEVSVTP